MLNVISKPKAILVFYYLKVYEKNIYKSKLAKHLDCSMNHAVNLINRLEKEELIFFDTKGRKQIIHLTAKGNEVAERVLKLLELLNEIPERIRGS